jgi:hypothetical protein
MREIYGTYNHGAHLEAFNGPLCGIRLARYRLLAILGKQNERIETGVAVMIK